MKEGAHTLDIVFQACPLSQCSFYVFPPSHLLPLTTTMSYSQGACGLSFHPIHGLGWWLAVEEFPSVSLVSCLSSFQGVWARRSGPGHVATEHFSYSAALHPFFPGFRVWQLILCSPSLTQGGLSMTFPSFHVSLPRRDSSLQYQPRDPLLGAGKPGKSGMGAKGEENKRRTKSSHALVLWMNLGTTGVQKDVSGETAMCKRCWEIEWWGKHCFG